MKAHGMGSQMVQHWDCHWESSMALRLELLKDDHWERHSESMKVQWMEALMVDHWDSC